MILILLHELAHQRLRHDHAVDLVYCIQVQGALTAGRRALLLDLSCVLV